MPTMTRMHRHSSSSAVVEENRGRRRGPGAGDANKENFGVHFMSSPFGNASLIALQDLSNVHGKSPQRRSFSEGSGPRQATPQLAALRSCLPRGGVGVGGGAAALEDSQLSSSRMGDTTLDRMLDAIIESARKEVRYKPNVVATATTTAAPTTTVLPENAEWSETSVHEMEVRTPTHLKRQRVVRRKNPHKTTGPTTGGQRPTSTTTTAQQLEHIPSTKRCLSFSSSSNSSDLEVEEDDEENQQVAKRGSLATPPSHCTTTSSTSSGSSGSSSGATDFGEASPRGSIDLSISYDAKEQKLNVHVIRCRDLQRSHGGNGGSINAYVKVALSGTGSGYGSGSGSGSSGQRDQRTAVHRHSSRPYFDQRFSFPICGGDFKDNDDFKEQSLQLAVWHRDRHLKRSEFLGCSTFPLSELLQPHAGTTAGSYKLQAQGCPPPSHRQSRENQHHNHQSHASVSAASTNPGENPEKAAAAGGGGGEREGEEQENSTEMAAITATPQKAAATTGTGTGSVSVSGSTAAALTLNDEVISISIDGDPSQQAGQQPMRLSKKALHQRDADENLFLRFLELDPPADGNANSTTVGATGDKTANSSSNAKANESNANHLNGSASRRHSTMPNSAGGGGGGAGVGGGSGSGRQTGRTPFTMTKRLTRTEERGFGFSIVWTHPPRVEKVEAGLSADRCGILPGDYVIFVDMHNVVTMPEADVLNLIRSQGSALTLEIFRRSGAGATTISTATTATATAIAAAPPKKIYGLDAGIGIGIGVEEPLLPTSLSTTSTHAQPQGVVSSLQRSASSRVQTAISRPATACSGTTSSIEAAKRRLHLPQVTFSKESIVPITDNRRRFLLQLISREQNFTAALHFGVQRFVQPLVERKDLISPNDHRTLFQNIDELLRIAEDILEQLCSSEQQDQDQPQMNFASRVYLSKTTAICAAYKKYCNGIKRADCVLVNKSRQTGSEFIAFITEPAVPRKRPDLTMFIHRPLQHFREILKLMQLLAGNCHVDTEEHKNFSTVIAELQAAYREITVSSGLMEPLGEGRPLLTLQDLESRMVFTKCKPFTLAVQGRQWIFGGDLSRVEGRSVKPYWTLLFSDIIVFAKVSRDRVLFITEEPIPIANVVDSCFHMRKKTTEFRLTVDPNGRLAESPTGYCAPDLTRTPKRGARRKSLILRAPSLELKAVWQNLLQRQIFLVNAALGSTPLSSPLDSPDVLNTLVPLSDIGLTSASMGSMKLPSLDSIHLKQQQKQQRSNNSQTAATDRSVDRSHGPHSHSGHSGHAVEQIELLIDEKCRILNKTGTPKSSALHLANWMKGQLDKQQQQARLAAIARSQENVSAEDEQLIFNSDSEQDERITYWTRQQLEKRTKELNLAKENGGLSAKPNFGGKRLSGVEELSMSATSDIYSTTSEAEGVTSQISQSHSTTSDSQITVRSSPIVLDKLAVCRHCHKNCQQSGGGAVRPGGVNTSNSTPVLLCNSLKVQHSQSSPNRCCKLNGLGAGEHGADKGSETRTGARTGTETGTGSMTSMSSSTITGEFSSKVVASSSRRETGDTESDVAQLITDEISISQSEATDDSVGAIPNSSSSAGDSKLRHLEQNTVTATPASPSLPNGHCSGGTGGSPKPLPPPRRTRIVAQMCQEPARPKANQQVKAIVTITETARIMRSSPTKGSSSVGGSPAKYSACHCRCTPEDFTNAQLSPDKMEHQTCKLLESPKQTATTMKQQQEKQEDDQLSLMLIGLAQFAPAAKLCGQDRLAKEEKSLSSSTPTIAVVPPTPDAVLTKTTTHVWDNSGCSSNGTGTATTSTATTTTKQPRQAIIENIPEDSCDESPLDEEPPYRPMSSALRRFGTMSSLEKLPSDDRMDEADELDDDLEPYTSNGHVSPPQNDEDDEEEARSDKALVQNLNDLGGASSSSGILVNGDVLASGAWTNRAGAFVSDKMSFFEESRAFIDKYLGRWNAGDGQQSQQQSHHQPGTASETDEQMDECTSGATSGEEVWGTPTSGGDNDDQDMQLINSENTHSSPTKSSTSLNDDDDTELMMDELLMAPPMTASTIRGLLPRRRLEPLFEEETESDEEKTQQDSDDVKKGEATTNGHYLEDSAGSSSDSEVEPVAEAGAAGVQPPVPVPVVPDLEEDPAEQQLVAEEQQQHREPLHPMAMGPRPLVTTRLLPTTAITTQVDRVLDPPVVSSCEYLLDQRRSDDVVAPADKSQMPAAMPAVTVMSTGIGSTTTTTMTMTTTRMTTMRATTTSTTMTTTMPSRAPSSTTTTISSGSGTTSSGGRASGRPAAKFVPPPPPPRRLLLTQTDLSAAKVKTEPPQRKSGGTADSGSLAAVDGAASVSGPTATGSRTTPAMGSTSSSAAMPAARARAEAGPAAAAKRPSSTIIETCLLGAPRRGPSTSVSATSSATVSKTAKPSRPKPQEPRDAVGQAQSSQDAVAPLPPPPAAATDAAAPHSAAAAPMPHGGCGLSPRLEMRLALNHDILGDEDLICYEPGPDLTTILGHDLSTFHRLTGRDLLSRSATNRVQPKEAVISFSQQRNSKMDTPTVNRRGRPLSVGGGNTNTTSRSSSSHGSPLAAGSARAAGPAGVQQPAHHQHQPGAAPPAYGTWSGSGYAGRVGGGSGSGAASSTASNSNRGGSKLGDLEILARREKIYCTSRSRSGSRVRETSTMSSTTLVAMASELAAESGTGTGTGMATGTGKRDSSWPSRAAAAASLTRTRSTTSMDGAGAISTTTTTTTMTEAFLETEAGKSKRLINFIKRRNSEITASSSSSIPNVSDGAQPSQSQSSLMLQRQSPGQSQGPDSADMAQMSPRKDNDKPSLNRRLWKQITKRRRTNSVSQIVAG
ncbi:platelet binding protein GspB isoform X2 [Drosophila bipectinata]|uniref:platelet binding protein GspB isoform X2 n=1 Tax=Drosophila bipectinata TaxID=42026 RepID=UPI001C8A33A7|nr:serine-rich adhesin for platelets isoform X4 [Drosophila bipectinata]